MKNLKYKFELRTWPDGGMMFDENASNIAKRLMDEYLERDKHPVSFTIVVYCNDIAINTINGADFLTHSAIKGV